MSGTRTPTLCSPGNRCALGFATLTPTYGLRREWLCRKPRLTNRKMRAFLPARGRGLGERVMAVKKPRAKQGFYGEPQKTWLNDSCRSARYQPGDPVADTQPVSCWKRALCRDCRRSCRLQAGSFLCLRCRYGRRQFPCLPDIV